MSAVVPYDEGIEEITEQLKKKSPILKCIRKSGYIRMGVLFHIYNSSAAFSGSIGLPQI